MLGSLVFNHRRFWIGAGRLESKILADRLAETAIDRPVFVTGLARAGTTIILELLAAHPDVETHKYQDYPFVFIPYWWSQFVRRARIGRAEAVERAHGDGIMITPESPEAMEEVVWMSFFDQLHDPLVSNVLDDRTGNSEFEKFYVDTIRKLLLRSRAQRYVSKGNYNITRMKYIRKLFPDACFIIPVRDPVSHVESLMRQHALFFDLARRDREVIKYFRRAGHFEFGMDRRPINVGDGSAGEVLKAWEQGEEVAGWALLWNGVHSFLQAQLDANPALKESVLLVPHEEFCRDPGHWVEKIVDHADLKLDPGFLESWKRRICMRTHGDELLSWEDRDVVWRIVESTATRFGYGKQR